MNLNELDRKLQDLTLGDLGEDLFIYLERFFSSDETKDKMIRLNQHQNYDLQVWRDGTAKPVYSPQTIEKRNRLGFYIPASKEYVAHETGDLFRSMGVLVTHEGVSIVSTTDSTICADEDFMEGSAQGGGIGDYSHIEYYFDEYDPSRNTLGITDESFATLRDDMVDSVLTQLKAYING